MSTSSESRSSSSLPSSGSNSGPVTHPLLQPRPVAHYLPPIVKSLGDDVIVNKVHLQCKPLSNGRFLYTYTVELSQDDLPESGGSHRASSKQQKHRGSSRSRSSASASDSETNYSVQSYKVQRPAASQTSVSTHKAPSSYPVILYEEDSDMTMRTGGEDELSSEIRQELVVTFYLFGETAQGDYFRRRLYEAYVSATSVRKVLRTFASAVDMHYRDFLDHLYVLPGRGKNLKDAAKWQKLTRDQLPTTLGHLQFGGQRIGADFVLIVDLIGVHSMAPSAAASSRKLRKH